VAKKQISTEDLKDVAETLLYPLISRYVGTQKDNGVIKDPKSVKIIDALDYDVEIQSFILSVSCAPA